MSPLNKFADRAEGGALRKLILCYITDRSSFRAAPQNSRTELLLERIGSLSAAGIDWIQIREKDLSGREYSTLARDAIGRISRRISSAGPQTRLIVNDRLDVALAERAGGIHLGEQSLPAAEARRLLLASSTAQTVSGDFLLGVSCHSLEAAKDATADGADYIFFGPVFATPSKAAYGTPQGIGRLGKVCASVSIPVLAIGGVTVENAPSCLAAGASGIAAIRLFQDAPDAASVIRALRP